MHSESNQTNEIGESAGRTVERKVYDSDGSIIDGRSKKDTAGRESGRA
jgi:hypothetical protein